MRVVLEAPRSVFAETLRNAKLASDVMFQGKSDRVIGVVSAMPGEGKSTTAANFAALLASSGKRTLLIDADLRNPWPDPHAEDAAAAWSRGSRARRSSVGECRQGGPDNEAGDPAGAAERPPDAHQRTSGLAGHVQSDGKCTQDVRLHRRRPCSARSL
jgi:hypothetical protein